MTEYEIRISQSFATQATDFAQPYKTSDSSTAIGTGFFVDLSTVSKNEDLISENALFVVTNAHVIDEAVKIWITTPTFGEERFDAELMGVCFEVDLAVLRVDDERVRSALKTRLPVGDSNAAHTGSSVCALGYPLGLNSLKLTVGGLSGRESGLLQLGTN